MEFNCDYDAPMFVDFENLEQSGADDDFFDTRLEEDVGGEPAPALEDEAPPKLPPKRVTRSVGGGGGAALTSSAPLKTLNRQNLPSSSSTTDDHLRPKTSATSSLKKINKSAAPPSKMTKEQVAQIFQRLYPSQGNPLRKNKFVSMAEETQKYFGTPERFHTTRRPRASSADAHLRGGRKRSPSPVVRRLITLTKPHSPRLLTRGRTRCNHPASAEAQPEKKNPSMERLASLRNRLGFGQGPVQAGPTSAPSVKHTATSKMRAEKAKNAGVAPLKHPLKTVLHNGIPILLHDKLSKKQLKSNADKKALPPLPANSVHLKLYEQDKEIRAKLEREREKVIEEEKKAAEFIAKDPTVLSKRPFLPKQCDKAPVRPINSQLQTQLRSEERQQFDQKLREKEAKLEAARKQEQERREQQEQLEMMKQRKQLVHQPVPIRHYNTLKVQPSDRQVTVPKTPNFSRRTRHNSS